MPWEAIRASSASPTVVLGPASCIRTRKVWIALLLLSLTMPGRTPSALVETEQVDPTVGSAVAEQLIGAENSKSIIVPGHDDPQGWPLVVLNVSLYRSLTR